MDNLPARNPSALIVDDNGDNCELFRVALSMAGYDTSEAANGVEALAVLENQTFDLMILDLQMPKLDGATVLRKLRTNSKYASMTIIVATANAHMAHTEVENLADYIIYKPFYLKEFISLVGRLRKAPAS